MSIREKPLIDSISRLGPLPGFLFESPFFAGIFAMIMCAVFGMVTVGITAAGYGHGSGNASALYDAARLGAYIGCVVGAVIMASLLIRALCAKERSSDEIVFTVGGFFGLVMVVLADLMSQPILTPYFEEFGRII